MQRHSAPVQYRDRAAFPYAGEKYIARARGFAGYAANLVSKEMDREIKNLRRKVQAGADFVLTQPIYQPEQGRLFLERYAEQAGKLTVPILVGVLPLNGPSHGSFLNNEVPGIDIPAWVLQRRQQAGENAPKEGIRVAIELIEEMRSWASGIYLMPVFNRYDLAAEIIEQVKGAGSL
jgi:homocysteine S-methyltransferase